MGQARSRLQRMQREQPFCVYCGGAAFGTTIDHMPPIVIFDGRRRLKGMEYLACGPCHEGTRRLDQVAGLLSRIYPNSNKPTGKEEVRRLLKGIRNNFPGLLEGMKADASNEAAIREARRVFPDAAAALEITPSVHAIMSRFAARVGLALHFELCREVVPSSGAVFIRWFTNEVIHKGTFPTDFANMLGDPKTLRQGEQSLGDQFWYMSRATPSKRLSGHLAAFRVSFGIQAFVALDRADLAPAVEAPPGEPHNNRVFRPGFLQTPLT